jgi:hypothetical protein
MFSNNSKINRKLERDCNLLGYLLLGMDSLLIFYLTFIAYHSIAGIPFFIFGWVILLIRRSFAISKGELATQLITILLFIPVLIDPLKYVWRTTDSELAELGQTWNNWSYFWGAITTILYINIVPFYLNFFKRIFDNAKNQEICKYVLLLLSTMFFIVAILSADQRIYFVFGPNILYRIVGIVAAFKVSLFYNKLKCRKSSLNFLDTATSIAVLLMTLFFCIKTGSRGALVVFSWISMLAFNAFLTAIKSRYYRTIVILLMVMLSAVLAFLYTFVTDVLEQSHLLDSRAFMVGGESVDERASFYSDLLHFIEGNDLLFGRGMNYTYAGDYPHNLYLDAFLSSGVFTFLGVIIASIKYLHLLISQSQDKPLHAMLISFTPMYIGSLFSGTLYNNYSILAVMISSLFLFSTLQSPSNISLGSIKPK